MPTHPVIFTKRATSIIANEEEILLHPDFTQTLDYEGEIGVIIGKNGFQVSEADAPNYIWGYTIINDVTAREKQRDHKQFYIGKVPLRCSKTQAKCLGKSADTYCPMGPIAVPASSLPKVLKVTTRVNGELRQEATTEDLIFSIPNLIKTLSESQTIRAGDVIGEHFFLSCQQKADFLSFLSHGNTCWSRFWTSASYFSQGWGSG